MWAIKIVEVLPHGQLFLEIDIVFVGEKLVELVFVGSVGPLNLPVELRRSCLDIDVLHAQVSHVPMEERLELMAAIGADGSYPKRKLLHHVVDEVDGIGLRVPLVDLQRSNSRGIVDRSVLVAPDGRSLLSRKREELHVYLYVMARNLLLIPMCVHGSSTHSVREPGHAMPLADAVDRGIGGLDVVVALEIPGNADRPHVIGPSQVQDLFNDLIGRLVGVIVRAAPAAFQALVAELSISISPEIEG